MADGRALSGAHDAGAGDESPSSGSGGQDGGGGTPRIPSSGGGWGAASPGHGSGSDDGGSPPSSGGADAGSTTPSGGAGASDPECLEDADCNGGVCDAQGRCQAPSCGDGVRNGSETGVDCGGGCPRCDSGEACRHASDCLLGVCLVLPGLVIGVCL